MKFNLKEIEIPMGIFDFTVICIVGDYENVENYIRWKCEDKEFDLSIWDKGYESRGKCFYRIGYVPILWIPRAPETPKEYGTLAHESLHAIWHLFDWASIPMTRDTEEVVTHAMAHIISTILKKL